MVTLSPPELVYNIIEIYPNSTLSEIQTHFMRMSNGKITDVKKAIGVLWCRDILDDTNRNENNLIIYRLKPNASYNDI